MDYKADRMESAWEEEKRVRTRSAAAVFEQAWRRGMEVASEEIDRLREALDAAESECAAARKMLGFVPVPAGVSGCGENRLPYTRAADANDATRARLGLARIDPT